jgi:DNA-binding Lrp family transcriptional regulator
MLKLDIKDKKLLYWLDQNSRVTNKELGKKVGLTEQTIGYKIKKMQEEGIITNFVTFINTLSLGYTHYKVFIKLNNLERYQEEKIIKKLTEDSNVSWVVQTSGRYDLSFSILAKTPQEFIRIYEKLESKLGRNIIGKNVVINTNSPGFTRGWLIDEKKSNRLEYKSSKKIQHIDKIDEKVIKAISQNSRKNIVDIAKEINETIDIVKYRLKKLKENKIINGFTIQLNLEKLGYEYYSVFLNMHNLSEALINKVISYAENHPNILFIVEVIGNYDLQLELEVKNYIEFENILKDFRKEFSENIPNFEILRVIREYKEDFYPFE